MYTLQAYNLSDTECLLEWTVYGDSADIGGFTVTREVVHGSTPAVSVTLPGTARRHRLTDLRPSTEYTVCIAMTGSGPPTTSETGTLVCTSVWTNRAAERPFQDEYGRWLAIILGCIFGGTVLLVLVAVGVVLLWRRCARRLRRKSVASSRSADAAAAVDTRSTATNRPQIGRGSKRFTKDRGGVAGVTERPRTVSSEIDGDRRPERPTSFTPEERATIIAMLAGTRVAAVGAGQGPLGYTNAAYEPSEFSAAGDSNGHVYDAIAGDQYFDVPLDSAV